MPPQAMDIHDNHYDFLGIPLAASSHEVRVALDGVIRQANSVAFTSPERSRELWSRVRRIRADLLSDANRREAYDAELLRALATAPLMLPPEIASTSVPNPRRRAWRPAWLVTALVSGMLAGVLVLAVLASTLRQGTRGHNAAVARPPAIAMTIAGSTRDGAYVADSSLRLRWSHSTHASRYRVQVATADGAASDSTMFRHPILTVVTRSTSYPLRVAGGRLYAWRLQELVHGRWESSGPAHYFYVAQRHVAPAKRTRTASHRRQTTRRRTESRPVEVAAVVRVNRSGHRSTPLRAAARRAKTSPSVTRVASVASTAGRAPSTVAYAPAPVSKPTVRRTTNSSAPPIAAVAASPTRAAVAPTRPTRQPSPPTAKPTTPPVRPPTAPPSRPAPVSAPTTAIPAASPPAPASAPGAGQMRAGVTTPPPASNAPPAASAPPPTSPAAAAAPPTTSPPAASSPPSGSSGEDGDGSSGHPAHPPHPAHPAHPPHPAHP